VKIKFFLLSILLLFAYFLRVFGLNWDQSYHLHPDERFLTMVASSVSLPKNLVEYLDPVISPLNPYTHGYGFYVYGTFPLLATKAFAFLLNFDGYDRIFLVGRLLSAIFDTGTVLLVFLICRQLTKKANFPLAYLAALFYTLAVFPIQQAHFFTVDSFTVFFTTLTIFLLQSYLLTPQKKLPIFLGLAFGLTLANKTSIIIILPLILLTILLTHRGRSPREIFAKASFATIVFFIFTFVSFRIFQPYAFDGLFHLSEHFLSNIKEAHEMITGDIDYPPNIQWAYTKPLIHPLKNIFLWGLGPILATFSILGFLYALFQGIRLKNFALLLHVFWIVTIFIYQGILLAKYMRYFYPIYPSLAILAAFFIVSVFPTAKSKFLLLTSYFLLLTSILIWPLAFISIYSRPHSRVLASAWIYQNLPLGSSLATEEWDDPLPLSLPNFPSGNYQNIGLPLYAEDNLAKWQKIASQLETTDFILLTSNRLYGSIPRIPDRYPTATQYYKMLFDGSLGFEKIAEITSRPKFLINEINDDLSEESFTVYDHPKVIIFKKGPQASEKVKILLRLATLTKPIYKNPKETNKLWQ